MLSSNYSRIAYKVLQACLISAVFSVMVNAQSTPKKAAWIADAIDTPTEAAVLHFRRVFSLAVQPQTFPIRISADNRFRLVVNGKFVASGPEWSDINHWRYESVELAPYLNKGKNTVAVVVWNWGAL